MLAAERGFSAGWAVPEGRAPPGPNGGHSAHGTAGVEGMSRKKFSECAVVVALTWLDELFSAPRHRKFHVLFPTSQRNRPVRVLVQVSKTRRAKREVDPHR